MKDDRFVECLNEEQAIAWDAVKAVIHGFLCKNRVENYQVLIDNMMTSFEAMDVHMSLKIHVLHAHIEFYERQKSTESDEAGERFHQTLMTFEDRFAGKRMDSMLADFCWSIANE